MYQYLLNFADTPTMSLDDNDFDVGAGNPGMDTWDDDDFYSESLQQVRGVLI